MWPTFEQADNCRMNLQAHWAYFFIQVIVQKNYNLFNDVDIGLRFSLKESILL